LNIKILRRSPFPSSICNFCVPSFFHPLGLPPISLFRSVACYHVKVKRNLVWPTDGRTKYSKRARTSTKNWREFHESLLSKI
jgi:hypothetical protein